MREVVTGYGKGPNRRPFGPDLADKRRKENRSLLNGKSRILRVGEIAEYVNNSLKGKSMAIGHLKVLEKERLIKRLRLDGAVVDLFETKVSIFYPSDKTRIFEIPLSDLLTQAKEALDTLPSPKESPPVRQYVMPPEGCVSLDTAAQKLGVTVGKLELLVPEMKNHGYTVPYQEHQGRKFIRKPDLDRMLGVKVKLIAFLNKVRDERLKAQGTYVSK